MYGWLYASQEHPCHLRATTPPHHHTTTPSHHHTTTSPSPIHHHHITTRPQHHATTPPHHNHQHTTTPPHEAVTIAFDDLLKPCFVRLWGIFLESAEDSGFADAGRSRVHTKKSNHQVIDDFIRNGIDRIGRFIDKLRVSIKSRTSASGFTLTCCPSLAHRQFSHMVEEGTQIATEKRSICTRMGIHFWTSC